MAAEINGEIRSAASAHGYAIGPLLAAGGTSLVYTATDRHGQRCALKILKGPFDNAWLHRFKLEADILSRLDHPGVVRVCEPGLMNLGSAHGFAMEYVDGIPLRAWLEKNGCLTEQQATEILPRVCEILKVVHAARIIHRDLHAGNILLVGGKIDEIRIVDFGAARDFSIAQVTESTGYKTFRPIGSMSHCAPEKWVAPHSADIESDIFSLGVLTYHAVSGRYPFWADSYVNLYHSIVRGDYQKLSQVVSSVSSGFSALIDNMLEPSNVYRIRDSEQVQARLEELRGS